MRCPSCKGAFPEGCSTCRPMSYTVGNVTFYPYPPTHTCPQCMRGLPCQGVDPSSLSSLVGKIATRKPSDTDWKRDTFPQETQ